MKETILIVEDEKDIAGMLEYNLKKEYFKTISLYDGRQVFDVAKEQEPDLIILDLMLPGMDGLEICRMLKNDKETVNIPIIMLTAKTQEADKVMGLELGADDYVIKPFSVRELIARIKAVLRRIKSKEYLPETLRLGNLFIDFSKISVFVNKKQVNLTSKEFELLKTLINGKGRVLSREYLLNTVWDFDGAMDVETRTVDAHIRTLRKKLKTEAIRIITVKNYGYRFKIEEDNENDKK